MPKRQTLTTLAHVTAPESQANFRRLQEKWGTWRLSDAEHKWLDLTDCVFIGDGRHEIGVWTFSRHLRLSELTGNDQIPLWVAAGSHWSDRWHDCAGAPYEAVPLIGIVRGISDRAAFLEPLRVQAVISSANAQFTYDELARLVPELSATEAPLGLGNPRFRCITAPADRLLSPAAAAAAIPCAAIEPIPPDNTGAFVSISVEEIEAHLQLSDRLIDDLIDQACHVMGDGSDVVYAYTFAATEDAALLAGDECYPIKVGWASNHLGPKDAVHAAATRILSQVPFAEPLRMCGVLRCNDGRHAEMSIHRQLRPQHIRCIGTEWFASNRRQVAELMQERTG